jgi:hypothetical protein
LHIENELNHLAFPLKIGWGTEHFLGVIYGGMEREFSSSETFNYGKTAL